MSFLYPRVIKITRGKISGDLGAVAYGGAVPCEEIKIAEGIPASIQLKAMTRKQLEGLPGDTLGRSIWRILIPLGAIATGTVQVRDIITDEQGVRYQVSAPYWNSLGYNLQCERLET